MRFRRVLWLVAVLGPAIVGIVLAFNYHEIAVLSGWPLKMFSVSEKLRYMTLPLLLVLQICTTTVICVLLMRQTRKFTKVLELTVQNPNKKEET